MHIDGSINVNHLRFKYNHSLTVALLRAMIVLARDREVDGFFVRMNMKTKKHDREPFDLCAVLC